jgi:Tol biopolymer transport system component/DNA-binding winged helix-turn-helix (wHTH) protein
MDRTVFEFGDITVDLGRMAAARAGVSIPLEPKAFDVLVYLIEHRDRLVTKDELLEAVWTGTFVTPNVLTRAVAQIRKALGESPDDARYIETVAKRGYRFVAPVTVGVPAGTAAIPVTTVSAPSSSPPPARRRARTAIAAALLVIAALGAAVVLLELRRAGSPPAADLHLTRLTNRRGFSGTPALSLDGRALVYSSDATGALELYLSSLTPGVAEVQLTRDRGHNMQPAWSPDGQWIAYHSRKRGGVWILPPTGGTPQQVTDFGSDPAWSPDSRTLVFTSDAGGLAGQSNLWTVGRDGSGRKPLTQIGTPAGGQRAPAWSHDGRLVAFVVTRGGWTMQIWTVNVATGEQHLIETTSNGADPAFAPDDAALIWGGSTATGNGRLFRHPIDAEGRPVGETDTLIPFDGGIVEGVSVAANGTLVFAALTLDANLWAVDVNANGRGGEPIRLTDDVARSTHPDYSADGRVAYQQVAIGTPPTVWVVNEDGSGKTMLVPGLDAIDPQWDPAHGRMLVVHHPPERGPEMAWVDLASRRLKPIGLPVSDMLSPRLSPDGTTIAFHVIEKTGRMSVSTTTLDGKRRVVATDPDAVSYPVWSRDGAWLAVEMKRGDSTQIGVVPAAGGEVVQLTDVRGQNWPHSWAPDNDRIAFAGERDGVWNVYTVSRTTRAVTQLTSFASASAYVRYPSWSPRGSRVVFERSQDSAALWTASLPSSQPPQ